MFTLEVHYIDGQIETYEFTTRQRAQNRRNNYLLAYPGTVIRAIVTEEKAK